MKLTDESDNKIVITTRYVLDANSLITYVVYDEDGDWQFYGNEDVDESDTCEVSVHEMLTHDDTLYFLPDLKPGQAAERSDADSEWQSVKHRPENLPLLDEEDN